MTNKAVSAKRRKIEVQPTRSKACRSLFGKPSAEFSKQLEQQVEKLLQDEATRFMLKWNFNAPSGKPASGNWQWEPVETTSDGEKPVTVCSAAADSVTVEQLAQNSVACRIQNEAENVRLFAQPYKLAQNLKQTKMKDYYRTVKSPSTLSSKQQEES